MKDKFKFRVWNKVRQHFMTEKEIFICGNGELVLIDEALNITWVKNNLNYKVSFCTDLKDKNGKLIYENDIVTDVLTNKFTINFDEKYLSFLLTNIKTKESMVFYPNIKLEIIGNTFENKELLNGQ